LRMNIATVTGPTPPGTGVTQLATSFTASVSTIADDHRLAVGTGDLVDADVDDRRAGLHHVGAQELRFPDRDEHGIRAARVAQPPSASRNGTQSPVAPSAISRNAAGFPTISEWPTITTSSPCKFRPVALINSTDAAAVHGASARSL